MSAAPSAFLALTTEACADAMRRRIVPVIGIISLLSLLAVDSCTSCSSGQLDLNGQSVAIADVAGWTGLAIFTVLALWTMVLAGVIASDHLSHPLSDGSAALALARPLTRDTFALSRLAGALAISWLTGALLLGGTTVLLALRSGASLGPALWGGLACAAGSFTVACLSMTSSLWLPQIATTLLVFASVGAVAVVNAVGQFSQEMSGVTGLIEHYGPPLASSLVVALAPWIEPTAVTGAPLGLALRAFAWCVGSAGLLIVSFRRLELGR
jgi:ABC-type transport system involved in multi-copper enzyme maturation permease subunit